eukprot:8966-Heterococcus_DN1.PRE.1
MRAHSPDQRTAAALDTDDIRLACNLSQISSRTSPCSVAFVYPCIVYTVAAVSLSLRVNKEICSAS